VLALISIAGVDVVNANLLTVIVVDQQDDNAAVGGSVVKAGLNGEPSSAAHHLSDTDLVVRIPI
jgi:hypothetical protein